MKLNKTKLLGIEIVTRNNREKLFVDIVRDEALNVLQWVDYNTDDPAILKCTYETRHNIARRTAEEVNQMFTVMFYLSMIPAPHTIDLRDILEWNGDEENYIYNAY